MELKTIISGVRHKSKDFGASNFLAFFDEIDWEIAKEQPDGETFTRIDHDSGAGIIYPLLGQEVDPERRLIQDVGQAYIAASGDSIQRRWLHKFTVARHEDVDQFQSRLESRSYGTYRDLVDSIDAPLTRLVAINLANALIANKTPISTAFNVKVREWGPTTEYATSKRYHSLTPLWSAYCPASIHQDFGLALAYAINNELKDVVSCSTLVDTVLNLIKEISS